VPAPLVTPTAAVSTVEAAIVAMQQIDAALPAADGVACFNRMYLDVTTKVDAEIGKGTFADPGFVSRLDVVFANLYFAAVNAYDGTCTNVPAAWRPLFEARDRPGVVELQFALAGMNAHINHDLPMAVVETCTELGTAPEDGSHHADYQKVDALLDAAEQSVRQSFESGAARRADHDVQGVLDLVCNWSMNSARDVAWDTSIALWRCRHVDTVEALLMAGLARITSVASRCLLVAV
jgi:Family of unknown function (DUF5995)